MLRVELARCTIFRVFSSFALFLPDNMRLTKYGALHHTCQNFAKLSATVRIQAVELCNAALSLYNQVFSGTATGMLCFCFLNATSCASVWPRKCLKWKRGSMSKKYRSWQRA